MTEPLWRLAEPLFDPASRFWWPALLGGLAVAGAVLLWRGTPLARLPGALFPSRIWRHRSTRLDVQVLLLRQLLAMLGTLPQLATAWWVATHLARGLDGSLGPQPESLGPLAVTALYSVVLFIAWDLSRYVLHRLMHRIEPLWQLHQVHHSAEVLTPLTFFRLHPVESWLYALRGAVVTGGVAGVFFWAFGAAASAWTLFGVHGVLLVFNVLFGNLRHSHVPLGFGDLLEGLFISPAQHQLHHSTDPAHFNANFGTWLALWDRWGGTLVRSRGQGPRAVGLVQANHDQDLISAMLGPLRAWLRPRRALVALALLPQQARADDADDESDEGFVIVVESEDGVPRTAGSAHIVSQAVLERQEYDDIHRVLAEVPGVYVRGEDGFGLRPNIGIRGVSSDRSAKVTLLEDGVLFAPAPYAAPAAYYFPMTTRLVGVEVFKGPAATQYGPNTVGGVINLRTREVPSDGLAGTLDLALGMRTTAKGHAWVGYGTERFGVLAEVVHLSSDGFRQPDDGGFLGFSRQEAMFKARLASDPDLAVHHELQLKLGYAREDSRESYLGLSLADFAENPWRRYAVDEAARMRFDRTQAELSWQLRTPAIELRSVLYHHYLDRSWNKFNGFASGVSVHDVLLDPDGGQAAVYAAILAGENDTVSDDQVLYIGPRDRQFHATGWQTTARWRLRSGRIESRLEAGLRLHGDWVERNHSESPFAMSAGRVVATGGETRTTLDASSRALALAGHLHEDLAIGPVRVLAGTRVEVIDTWLRDNASDEAPLTNLRAAVLPGVGVHGTPVWWLNLLAGAHRGFTPVPPGEDPEVQPEHSWNFEAGARLQPGRTYAEVLGFFDDYDNIAGQCTISGGCADDDVGRQFSGGAAWVYGVEAQLAQEVPLPAELRLRGSLTYTWTETRFRTGFTSDFAQYGTVEIGDAFPYVPRHQGAARLSLEHPRGGLTIAGNYRGEMRDIAGQGEISDTERIPGVFLLDVSADVQVHERLRLYATANNLLDTVYLESLRPYGARPGAPRQVTVGAKVSL